MTGILQQWLSHFFGFKMSLYLKTGLQHSNITSIKKLKKNNENAENGYYQGQDILTFIPWYWWKAGSLVRHSTTEIHSWISRSFFGRNMSKSFEPAIPSLQGRFSVLLLLSPSWIDSGDVARVMFLGLPVCTSLYKCFSGCMVLSITSIQIMLFKIAGVPFLNV